MRCENVITVYFVYKLNLRSYDSWKCRRESKGGFQELGQEAILNTCTWSKDRQS